MAVAIRRDAHAGFAADLKVDPQKEMRHLGHRGDAVPERQAGAQIQEPEFCAADFDGMRKHESGESARGA